MEEETVVLDCNLRFQEQVVGTVCLFTKNSVDFL